LDLFKIVLQTICPGWLRTVILLIAASWVARIPRVSHWHLAHSSLFTHVKILFPLKGCVCLHGTVYEPRALCMPSYWAIPPTQKHYTFFFFFGSTGVWTQSLDFEPLHQPFCMKGFFEVGSHKLFAQAVFKLWSSLSLPSEQLGLQVWATGAQQKITFWSETLLTQKHFLTNSSWKLQFSLFGAWSDGTWCLVGNQAEDMESGQPGVTFWTYSFVELVLNPEVGCSCLSLLLRSRTEFVLLLIIILSLFLITSPLVLISP
jgi:hypothetical protein